MKTRRHIVTALALAALAAPGCRQSCPDVPESEWISFGTQTVSAASNSAKGTDSAKGAAAPATRTGSTLIDTDAELRAQAFGIYGYKSLDDMTNFENVFTTDAAQKVYFTTTAITGQAEANTWTYDDRQKWETAKRYRFRAYWPYTADVLTGSSSNFLAIEYKQLETYDLMVAYATRYPLKDAEGVNRVPMQFHHALSGLRFRVRFKESPTIVNVTDYVTGLYVTGLNTSGTLIYGEASSSDTATTLRWSIGSGTFDSATHFFDWSGSEKFAVGATVSEVTIASVFDGSDKVVLTIPQTLSSSDSRQTLVHFSTQTGGSAVQRVKIPQTTLEAGKIYTYTLIVSESGVTVNVKIEDWTETQSNVDIYL